jgi:phage-related protein
MAADGSIIIDTRLDTRGFKNGATNIKTQFGKLSGIIGKLGAAIGAAFAVRAIVNFGKEALELGSDLQEVQNVVDVTFSTMSDRVDEFARNMAAAAGLSETMAKRYTGTYGAMSKSFGFAEAEAYEMSTTLTQLTGDVASFYNITQDMAYTKLKSVFTGETESLKDLGVVMTQSALDAYALSNGFGKTTSAMTEQEKVALRYRFVLDQLSAASGDFIRTADGWANQTRILKLQFDSLKASIGQGLINLLTPALQMINTLLAKLNALAASFKSFTEMLTGKKSSGMASGYNSAAKSAENLATATTGVTEATKEAAKAAEGYLSPLDEINKMNAPEAASSAGGGGTSIGGGASMDYGSIEEGETIVDKTTESFKKLQAMFKPLKKAWSEYGQSIKTTFKGIGSDLLSFGKEFSGMSVDWFSSLDFTPLFGSFDLLMKKIRPLVNLITDGLLWAYENVFLPFGKWTIEKALPAGIDFLSSKIDLLTSGAKLLSKAFVFLYDRVLKDLLEMIGKVAINGAEYLSGFNTFVSGVFSGDMEKAFSGIEQMLRSLEDAYNNVFTYIQEKIIIPFDRFLSKVFTTDWRNAFGILGNILNGFSSSAKTVWEGIKQVFNGVNTFIQGVFSRNWKQAWDGIKQIFYGIFESMAGFVSTPINSIIGMINALIDSVVEALNYITDKANSLLSKVPTWMNGNKHYYNHINIPRIPYLATGAVIPPNAPFMAMLGDQRHGNNIEAPESLIRRIVREESGSGGNGYTFVGQINRRVLFEEFITEAKLRQQTAGKNPFEFA